MPKTAIALRLGSLVPSAAVIWAVSIVAAPWMAAASSPFGAGAYAAAGTYWIGALVCHQRPERSFHLLGAQLPVCARCAGLYLSVALGVVVARARRRTADPSADWRLRFTLAAIPTVATLAIDWWRPQSVSGAWRAIAAVPLGVAAGVFLAESMSFRGKLHRCERTRQSA